MPLLLDHHTRIPRWSIWSRNALLALTSFAILVLAFFFLAVALVAGTVLAAAVALRFWWLTRRLRQRSARSSALEGEYHVIERDSRRRDR